MDRRRSALGLASILACLAAPLASQSLDRTQPYCIQGASLDAAGERKCTLVVRDGTIASILDEAAPAPPGTRIIDGKGLICLPAFLDAYSRQGCTVPLPVKDQDVPPNEQADVGIDMRLANRKGIQPGFHAATALAISKDQSESWRRSGFGALLVAPGGELLSGSSVLATTREAAMRDVIVRDDVFSHAAFGASGPGYPSTLMGYIAQLRQFFLDSQRQRDLAARFEQGRPGPRPPFDAQLQEGAYLIGGQHTLLCAIESASDIERWLKLADEFDLAVSFSGGIEAWRVAALLANRDIPVVLTLDWGKEVKDPRPKAEEKKEGSEAEAPKAEPTKAEPLQETPPEGTESKKDDSAWEYVEPYGVRLERRLKWEEGRNCALRLHEAGVRFLFGTGSAKPNELLQHVRTLIKEGLPESAAVAALTSSAAAFLGVDKHLGSIAVGKDATFTLWRSNPLTDEKATPAWVFVDGYPTEFKEEKKEQRAGPNEGLDPTGTWQLEFAPSEEGPKAATLVLKMEADGQISGQLTVESPMDASKVQTEIEGQVSKDEIEVEAVLRFGEFQIETRLTGKVDSDTITGEGSFKGPWSPEPTTRSFQGKRGPQ